jgi:7-carboxy-7-deazaguanine synthase (Cx14CxxC type)
MYSVKEIFYTLQGEGAMAGRASVFCRFSGCNLWNGREQDRQNAICKFCDTDFVGTDGINGGKYSSQDLAGFIHKIWVKSISENSSYTMSGKPYVVLTGGEPLLQVDKELLDELHAYNFEIAIETNGTQPILDEIDWVCVSPKFGSKLVVNKGNEIKVIYPQGFNLEDMAYFSTLDFKHFFVQAKDEIIDKKQSKENLEQAVNFCLTHTKWQLSLQTHKYLGIA